MPGFLWVDHQLTNGDKLEVRQAMARLTRGTRDVKEFARDWYSTVASRVTTPLFSWTSCTKSNWTSLACNARPVNTDEVPELVMTVVCPIGAMLRRAGHQCWASRRCQTLSSVSAAERWRHGMKGSQTASGPWRIPSFLQEGQETS